MTRRRLRARLEDVRFRSSVDAADVVDWVDRPGPARRGRIRTKRHSGARGRSTGSRPRPASFLGDGPALCAKRD